MSKILLATFGSLGDLHPKIALGLELRKRGHDVTIAAMEFYREKIESLGLGFAPMAPHLNVEDRQLAKDLMDLNKGPERMMKLVLLPALEQMYQDLSAAVEGKDLLVTGEVVLAGKSVVEKTGIPWVSTSLMPLTLFSAYDPNVYPTAGWYEYLHFLPPFFHMALFSVMQQTVAGWFRPYREFRKNLGLDPNDDPVFRGKYSPLLHLALFSRVLGAPQPDWPPNCVQTGFCFYDGQSNDGRLPPELETFLNVGDPPIVFTLGSAAVLDAGDFFSQSVRTAKMLGRRAILIYGRENEPPPGLDKDIAAIDYAPFSLVFPRAACVVHQGGAGTTGQVLRAGVPHLIMPYGHDQPDNAARCRRLGVAEVIDRSQYNAVNASSVLKKLLTNNSYSSKAQAVSEIVKSEHGTQKACDEIERVLNEDIK